MVVAVVVEKKPAAKGRVFSLRTVNKGVIGKPAIIGYN